MSKYSAIRGHVLVTWKLVGVSCKLGPSPAWKYGHNTFLIFRFIYEHNSSVFLACLNIRRSSVCLIEITRLSRWETESSQVTASQMENAFRVAQQINSRFLSSCISTAATRRYTPDCLICVRIEFWSGLLPEVPKNKFSYPKRSWPHWEWCRQLSAAAWPHHRWGPEQVESHLRVRVPASFSCLVLFLSLYFCFRASCKKAVHELQAYLESVSLMLLGVLEKHQGILQW